MLRFRCCGLMFCFGCCVSMLYLRCCICSDFEGVMAFDVGMLMSFEESEKDITYMSFNHSPTYPAIHSTIHHTTWYEEILRLTIGDTPAAYIGMRLVTRPASEIDRLP
jgi:hypothetical protein